MATVAAEAVRAEANRGIEALRARRAGDAGEHFDRALALAEELADDRERRDEIAVLAMLFTDCGFPDLALMAGETAVELDRQLGLTRLRGEDLVSVGNAHVRMDNEARAEAAYREALALFEQGGDWADAASATTNLAGIIANRGDFGTAVEMLTKSLGLLEREPFEDTEKNTRFALLQVLELGGGDVDLAFENARTLGARYWAQLDAPHQEVLRDFVTRMLARYEQGHPEAGKPAWRAAHFPMLEA